MVASHQPTWFCGGAARPACFDRQASMARTVGRRWKGCQLCKPHKNARPGDAYRMPISAARRGYGGRLRRINRHDIDDQDR